MPIDPEYLHAVHKGPFTGYLYARASRDPKKKGRSVNAQLKEGRELCARYGWPIVEEFKDVGISASRHAKTARDDFEAMLEGVRAGHVRIVVAFEASRYYRDLEAYTRLRDACHDAGVLLYYKGQVYDFSKSADRKATAMDAVQAESEAEDIRDRNLRTARQTAEAGKPWGPVPEGYKRVYDPDSGDLLEQIVHPERGPMVESIWEDAAAGKSLRGTCQRLKAEKWLTQRGKEFREYHLRTILRNPAYMGRRVFQGKDYKKGTWPALVKPEVFDAVQLLLDMEGRAWATDLTPSHLLAGIALCGEHPEMLATNAEPVLKGYVNRGYPSLRCSDSAHTTINEAKLVAYVEEALLDYLSTDAAKEAFLTDDTDQRATVAQARLKVLTEQLEEAQEAATTFDENGVPGLSISSLNAIEQRLTPLINAAKAAAKPQSVPDVLRNLLESDDPDALWNDEYDLQQQRAVLRLCMTVRLHKATTPGVRSIQPGRVTIAFKGEPGFMGGRRRGLALLPEPGPQGGL